MKIFTGIRELVESPSGLFSLICLTVMAILSWHRSEIGTAAWVAFFGVVPAILAACEHLETTNVAKQISQNPIESIKEEVKDLIK